MRKKYLISFFLILCLVFSFCINSFALDKHVQMSDFIGDYILESKYISCLSENLSSGNQFGKLVSARLCIHDNGKSNLIFTFLDELTTPGFQFINLLDIDYTIQQKVDSYTGEKIDKFMLIPSGRAHIDIIMSSSDGEYTHMDDNITFNSSDSPDEICIKNINNHTYLQCGDNLFKKY